jgi:hypothetical protein
MKYQLYKILNNINGKYYIGIHYGNIIQDNYYGSGKLIKNAIEKYGKENFQQIIIEEFDNSKDAYIKENEIVNENLISEDMCYNLMVGGKGASAGANHPMFGKIRKDILGDNNPAKRTEVKYKISLHKKGDKNPMFGIKPTNIKSVLQYDLNMNLIKEWNDITQASKELNIYNSNISMCCKGKLKTTGGYIWKYKNNL